MSQNDRQQWIHIKICANRIDADPTASVIEIDDGDGFQNLTLNQIDEIIGILNNHKKMSLTAREIQPKRQFVSSVQKNEDMFSPLPPWRASRKRNDFLSDFLNYIQKIYLPKTSHYQGQEVTRGAASAWISSREYQQQGIDQLEAIWGDFEEYQEELAKNQTAIAVSDAESDRLYQERLASASRPEIKKLKRWKKA